MNYARWCTDEEMKKHLTNVKKEGGFLISGVPLLMENDEIYVDDSLNNNLVIASTDSNKYENIILPLIKASVSAGESILINDSKAIVLQRSKEYLQKNNYQIIELDLDNPKISYNPFALLEKIYLENPSRVAEAVSELAYYLFYEKKESVDDFWINSSIDYFTGLVLYLLEKETPVSLREIFNLYMTHQEQASIDNFLRTVSTSSDAYLCLSGTLLSPVETRGGIFSTFSQKIKNFVMNCSLFTSGELSFDNFDLSKKSAIFITNSFTETNDAIIPLLISQIAKLLAISKEESKRVNILLDEFDKMNTFKNITKFVNYAEVQNYRITILIEGYNTLLNCYGKELTEMIKTLFPHLIYLLSQDVDTLEEISRCCGKTVVNKKEEPLISISELRVMKTNEAIILIPRMMPYKAILPNIKNL